MMSNILDKQHQRSGQRIGIFLFFISCFVILAALFIDYVLGFEACILCIYERIPYGFIAIFSLLLFLIPSRLKLLLLLNMLCFFIGESIAVYHVGIERNLWNPSSQCSSQFSISDELSLEDFKNHLHNAKLGDCSKPAMHIIGLSLAEINMILNFVLIIFLILEYRKL
ncbi:MAG: disulfide bond formation protein B [Rickettsiaceae bacterium]|nr:disulfide bond formation protein B [Rickettsiaceae bacterium]